jgi:hypothetical protein
MNQIEITKEFLTHCFGSPVNKSDAETEELRATPRRFGYPEEHWDLNQKDMNKIKR